MGHVGVFFVTPDKIVKIINLGVKVGSEEKKSEAWDGETKDREGFWDFRSSS